VRDLHIWNRRLKCKKCHDDSPFYKAFTLMAGHVFALLSVPKQNFNVVAKQIWYMARDMKQPTVHSLCLIGWQVHGMQKSAQSKCHHASLFLPAIFGCEPTSRCRWSRKTTHGLNILGGVSISPMEQVLIFYELQDSGSKGMMFNEFSNPKIRVALIWTPNTKIHWYWRIIWGK